MSTNFSASRGEQNNNTGEGHQFKDTNFNESVNFNNLLQLQVYHGATEGRDQRAHESLAERLGNQITATPTYLSPAQSLLRQKMFYDAKEHSQLVATTIEGEIHRFSLPPTPSPDHFIQLGPAFGELEGQQGLLLDPHQLHNILAQSVVQVLSNTEKRPPLDSTLVRVSLLELFLSLYLLEGRKDPLHSLQRVSDAGRRELQKGISQWLFIKFVPDAGQDLFEKLQHRDTENILGYSDGLFIDEMRQSMGSAAHTSPSDRYRKMALPGSMFENASPKDEPVYGYDSEVQSTTPTPQTVTATVQRTPATSPASYHDEVDNHTISPSPVGKHPMRGPAKVPEDKGNWKDRSTKPVARASQFNSTQSPRQFDSPSTPDTSVMNERRKSIDNKVRQILMAGMLKPQRNPGTVCLSPAHPREGSYKIYYRRENAARRSRQCYTKQVPFLQIQCENIIIIKRLVLAEFTDWTQTLECNMCGHNHKDWIAALDADIKASIQAWARLLETVFETSQVPKIGFSRDTHRWRKWASETAK